MLEGGYPTVKAHCGVVFSVSCADLGGDPGDGVDVGVVLGGE